MDDTNMNTNSTERMTSKVIREPGEYRMVTKEEEEQNKLMDEVARGRERSSGQTSDGSTAPYYTLPPASTQLQDLISYKDMNGQMAEIFRSTYRYGQPSHSGKMRDIKKIIFYAQAELERLETYEVVAPAPPSPPLTDLIPF